MDCLELKFGYVEDIFLDTGFLFSFGICTGSSSCRPGWPQTPPASAFQVLGLKACATTARRKDIILNYIF